MANSKVNYGYIAVKKITNIYFFQLNKITKSIIDYKRASLKWMINTYTIFYKKLVSKKPGIFKKPL